MKEIKIDINDDVTYEDLLKFIKLLHKTHNLRNNYSFCVKLYNININQEFLALMNRQSFIRFELIYNRYLLDHEVSILNNQNYKNIILVFNDVLPNVIYNKIIVNMSILKVKNYNKDFIINYYLPYSITSDESVEFLSNNILSKLNSIEKGQLLNSILNKTTLCDTFNKIGLFITINKEFYVSKCNRKCKEHINDSLSDIFNKDKIRILYPNDLIHIIDTYYDDKICKYDQICPILNSSYRNNLLRMSVIQYLKKSLGEN